MLHRRFVLSAQRISPRKGKKPGGFFLLAEVRWPGKASSRLLQAGISPWSLTPHYLFSLNCCHQLCWALWEAASRAAPSSDTFLCTSDIHTVSHGVPPCGCRYSRAGWCILADLILLPAAATDFVLEGKKTVTSPLTFLPATNLNFPAPGNKAASRLSLKNPIPLADRSFWKAKLEGILQLVENSGWLKC